VTVQTRLAVLLILVLAALTAAADSIEVIELQHRPAAELIPLIEPLVDGQGAITGQAFKLIVRGTDAEQAQIRKLVEQLDTAARQLMVSVFQGSVRDLHGLDVGGQVAYDSETGALVSGRALSTRTRSADHPLHRLRISEGNEGYIETGASIPYFSGRVWHGPRGDAVEGGVDYKDTHTGFYVLARTHGDQVTLNISPYRQIARETYGGQIDTRSASTTITGKLGKWLQIGGVNERRERSISGGGSRFTTRGRASDGIWIRVDPAD
jgi:hypothetical protein